MVVSVLSGGGDRTAGKSPCHTHHSTKPGWLLATIKRFFAPSLAALFWYVLVPLTVEMTVGGQRVTVHQPRGSVKDETPLLKAQGGLTAGRSVASRRKPHAIALSWGPRFLGNGKNLVSTGASPPLPRLCP